MAININHSNNTFCSNSGVFIFGTGLTPIIENTVYSSNFSGKYHGDGSALTGLVGQFISGPSVDGTGSYYNNNPVSITTFEDSNYSSMLQGTGASFVRSNYSTILNGKNNSIGDSCGSIILNGRYSDISLSQNSLLFGVGSNHNQSNNSITFGNDNAINYSCHVYTMGNCNNIGGFASNVHIFGSGISVYDGCSNVVYVNNLCTYDGAIYGNGCGITGLDTGSFITTGQTGAFGGGNVDLTNYVTTGQTGVFALAANTGSFVTTAQTGVFALAAETGSFVTTAQTGVFALAAETGSFVTTAQTGVFALSANTGAFVTTGQTGVFITRPNDFINAGNNNSFVLGSNNSVSGCGNFIRGSSNVISGCYGQILGDGNKTFGNANGNVILSSSATISGYACNNAILGGVLNVICQNTFASVILGGLGIVADTSFTAYATNFCTYGGKYYGDGSALTGIVGAGGVSTPQQTSVLLTGATGFTQYHQAKNVGILAQNCFFGQEGAGNSGYLLLDKGGVNETNNLFTISPTAYCIGTFSAMLIGNGYVNGAATTTSMRIDGAYGNGIVLNQVKNIYFKTQNLNDANVVIEDNNFRIAVSGISGTMVWSSKIDLLDMNGYD